MRTRTTILLLLICACQGCQSMGKPQWFNPGPASYQQQRAQRFDPYPDNEIGPPVIGARPPDYTRPPAETTRARWNQWGAPRYGYQ